MTLAGCQTVKPYDYTNFRAHPPRSILVLPPLNDSTAIEGTYGYLSTVSNTVSVGVYQPVAISIARSAGTVPVGHSFRIYGVVTPRSSGIGLQLQQYVGGRWVVIATGRSGTGGAYSFTKVARYLGTATFRLVAPASGYRLSGHSSVTRVTIYKPYTPPPPPPPTGGGGGGGSGIG